MTSEWRRIMFEKLFVALLAFMGVAGISGEIVCEREDFPGHLQGIAADPSGICWSFYDTVVKTDYRGKIIASAKAPRHSGDLCIADGRVPFFTSLSTVMTRCRFRRMRMLSS